MLILKARFLGLSFWDKTNFHLRILSSKWNDTLSKGAIGTLAGIFFHQLFYCFYCDGELECHQSYSPHLPQHLLIGIIFLFGVSFFTTDFSATVTTFLKGVLLAFNISFLFCVFLFHF